MPAFKTSRWIRMQIVLTTSLSTLRLGSNYKGKAIIKYESPMFIIAKFNWFGQNSGLKGSISSFLAIKRIIYLSLIFVKHNQKLWFHSFTHAKMESSLMSIVRAHDKTMEMLLSHMTKWLTNEYLIFDGFVVCLLEPGSQDDAVVHVTHGPQ